MVHRIATGIENMPLGDLRLLIDQRKDDIKKFWEFGWRLLDEYGISSVGTGNPSQDKEVSERRMDIDSFCFMGTNRLMRRGGYETSLKIFFREGKAVEYQAVFHVKRRRGFEVERFEEYPKHSKGISTSERSFWQDKLNELILNPPKKRTAGMLTMGLAEAQRLADDEAKKEKMALIAEARRLGLS